MENKKLSRMELTNIIEDLMCNPNIKTHEEFASILYQVLDLFVKYEKITYDDVEIRDIIKELKEKYEERNKKVIFINFRKFR